MENSTLPQARLNQLGFLAPIVAPSTLLYGGEMLKGIQFVTLVVSAFSLFASFIFRVLFNFSARSVVF
jgi:uncharacterized membrane protein YagU involved in acid resistance